MQSSEMLPMVQQPVHRDCGQSIEGIENTVGPIWRISCWNHVRSKSLQEGRISAKRGKNKQIKGWRIKLTRSFTHLMWERTFYHLSQNLIGGRLLIAAI